MDNKINNNPMEVSIMSERKYPVITISREFGAGGHSIARVVSESTSRFVECLFFYFGFLLPFSLFHAKKLT